VSSKNRAGIGIVVVVVVVLGVLFLAPFGDGTFSISDEVARLSNPDVTIETTFSSDGTSGTFTATGAPICDGGDVTRKDSGTTATDSWYEDEYQCGAGAFILRGELPLDPDTAGDSESLHGTWLITSGRDDYGDLKGNGTSTVTFGPPRIDSYTGTATYGG
jgi:hypothetical protein